MSDLDAEIARIAALRGERGRTAELVARAHIAPQLPPIRPQTVLAMAYMQDDPKGDMRAFDILPPVVRCAVRQARVPLNAAMIAGLVVAHGSRNVARAIEERFGR